MNGIAWRRLVVCWLLLWVWGCSPTLNWREVQLDRLLVFLPCKPDRAQRTVQLGTAAVPLDMVGCEAGGALFAASHLRTERADQTDALVRAWQAATFANMRAATPQELPATGPTTEPRARQWSATGRRTTGEPVQARLVWWISGTDVFHIAVYAEKLNTEHTETLLTQARIQ